MRRTEARAGALAAIAFIAVLLAGGLAPRASAAGADPSTVVLVFDVSASILNDTTTRDRFGTALVRIADRVNATAADLAAGDATVSIVIFASRAADYPGCSNLKLLGSPTNVARFAECLRLVGRDYRRGGSKAIRAQVGIDTNYVAAMERAAVHLPADAVRPALILFTDGKHDVAGVPVTLVQPARERLFGARSPFALLPVGMGIDPKQRGALTAGLEQLRIVKDMPACASGATFDWPQVVFETADQAAAAVAVALQDATCTFTVAPTPTPPPTPVPATPAPVAGPHVTAGDGTIDVAWSIPGGQPADTPVAVDFQVRCRTDGGDWILSAEGVSTSPKTTLTGLTNGATYECQVAAVGASTSGTPPTGAWVPAGAATPLGKPAPPTKPVVTAANQAVQISVPAATGDVDQFRFECSADNGVTWTAKASADPGGPTVALGGLTNGIGYVCRAFAANALDVSDASPLSDAVTPCSGFLDCNQLFLPVLGGLGVLLVGGIGVALFALARGRTTGYVIAVVDVVHTANIGHGSSLGLAFVRDGRAVTGIVAERGSKAEIRIRRLRGGRFAIRDKDGRQVVDNGQSIQIADSNGVRHSLTLRAFATNAASRVATRR